MFNLTDLASEVQESPHCQICHRSLAAKDWAWQCLESNAHAILNPDEIVQLGVKLRCFFCKAIHLALPFPRHQGQGVNVSVWVRVDTALDITMRSLPRWNGFTSKAVGELRDIAKKTKKSGTATAARLSVEDDLSRAVARPPPFFNAQAKILQVVDQMFDEQIRRQRQRRSESFD